MRYRMAPVLGTTLLWAVLLTQSRPMMAQDALSTLAGLVVDSAYHPIPDVLVYLDSVRVVDWSDPLGRFELRRVVFGPHRIHLRKVGWRPQTFRFTLGEGNSDRIDLGVIPLLPGAEPRVTVTGAVLEQGSSRPVVAADILLNGRSLTQADEAGHFEIRDAAVVWGSNLVTIRRVGYASVTEVIWVDESSSTFELAIGLEPLAVLLPEVAVLGDRTVFEFGRMRGFWRRWRAGFGTFLTREDIERSPALDTSDLLRVVPGVLVQDNGYRTQLVNMRHGGRCHMDVFVDGILMVGNLDINAYTVPEWIQGIEIYAGAETIPPEFNQRTRGCGAIVIWTR